MILVAGAKKPDTIEAGACKRAAMLKALPAHRRGSAGGPQAGLAFCEHASPFVVTVLQGFSVQALDGASRRDLVEAAPVAFEGWPKLDADVSATRVCLG